MSLVLKEKTRFIRCILPESRLYVHCGNLSEIPHYPGGCRGGWYKLGRKAEYFVKLQARGIFRETRIGKAAVNVCNAGELADAMREMFAADPAILLHKSGCADCARLRSRIVKPE